MSTTRRSFLALLGGAAALPIVGKLLPALEPEIAIEQVPIYEGYVGVYRGVVIREVSRCPGKSIWRDEVIRLYRANNSFERHILPNRSA